MTSPPPLPPAGIGGGPPTPPPIGGITSAKLVGNLHKRGLFPKDWKELLEKEQIPVNTDLLALFAAKRGTNKANDENVSDKKKPKIKKDWIYLKKLKNDYPLQPRSPVEPFNEWWFPSGLKKYKLVQKKIKKVEELLLNYLDLSSDTKSDGFEIKKKDVPDAEKIVENLPEFIGKVEEIMFLVSANMPIPAKLMKTAEFLESFWVDPFHLLTSIRFVLFSYVLAMEKKVYNFLLTAAKFISPESAPEEMKDIDSRKKYVSDACLFVNDIVGFAVQRNLYLNPI